MGNLATKLKFTLIRTIRFTSYMFTSEIQMPTNNNNNMNHNDTLAFDSYPRERTVFVSGLDYNTSEAEIYNFFAQCSQIELLKVPKYKNTEKNIGYCHVTFMTKEGQENALLLNGFYLN